MSRDPKQPPTDDETPTPPPAQPAPDDAAADETSDDPVTEASLESFPASDAPGWIDEAD